MRGRADGFHPEVDRVVCVIELPTKRDGWLGVEVGPTDDIALKFAGVLLRPLELREDTSEIKGRRHD